MLLIATTLYLKVGAQWVNGIAQRGESDSFYAADAGINALAGQLSASGLGTKPIASSALPFVTTSNLTGLTQSDVTAAVLAGTISLSAPYQGATPQNIGNGLGSLVYSIRAFGCQAGTSNGANAPCSVDESNVISTLPLPAEIARIDVMSLGFREKSVASNVAISIFPNPKSFFAINKFAGFGDSGITVGNGDTYSAMPFCAVVSGVVDCQTVTYISAVLRNKTSGAITYITDPTDPAVTDPTYEKVTNIYKDGTGAFFETASNNTVPSGATLWSSVLVDGSNHVVLDANGHPQPQPLPIDTTGTLSSYAPAVTDSAIINNGGVLNVDSTRSYLPQGTGGNLGSNGTGVSAGGTAISTSSGSTINGGLSAACGTSCISVGGTATGETTGMPPLDLPSAPSAPNSSASTCSSDSPTGSCTIAVNGNGSTAEGQAIIPVATCTTNCGSLKGADKYPVINLVGSSGSGGVSLSGQNTLTLYPGRYIVSDLDISGNAILKTVQTNGDPVVLYVINSTNVGQIETLSISGNGIANTSTAAGLQIYSNTNDQINLNGNGALRAAIYAPNSSLTLNGGGNSGGIIGTYIGRTINFNGTNSQIVYDESLGNQNLPIVTGSNVRLSNWKRL